ncbi:hypothetical protein WA026_020337 [Henosepilachna vigintioctopunctata]|uniref:S1 motif domain-containing protein n=1 Tax=Henosepilachna vigintioctopunctata TaxID=420089 RepID=A0AAW1TYP1_9CUCU
MVEFEEEDFPRGGKKVTVGIKRKHPDLSLFSNATKKSKKIKTIDNNEEDSFTRYIDKKDVLTTSNLQEGMTILACVKKITEHAIEVELPNLLSAKVTINSISNPLNNILKKLLKSSDLSTVSNILKDIFVLGQYVPFKMRNIENSKDKLNIFGSISPNDINVDRRYNSFRKGELLWAAVVSELDHGYQLDSGVPNCRIFLPHQNIEEGKQLKIGQPIWCKIHKVDNQSAASTLRVGVKIHHIDSVFTDENAVLNFILPGTKVEAFVEKVLNNGICCKFLNNYVGFIHESQMNPPMKKISSIKAGMTVSAYVLYVEELTKVTYLTLRGLESEFQPKYTRGDKISGTIMGSNSSGLYIRLNQNERGWISNRRLLNSLGKKSQKMSLIKEKYPNGSKHKCIILSYNHMDRVYICGVEKELLQEKYFNFKDFSIGELLVGIVHSIKPNGIILSVGQIKGFIPNIHLTDSPYSDNLKKKFSVGQKVKARVFSRSEENVIFTLKSKFVNEENCLSSLEDLTINHIYSALVLKAKQFGLVVAFYNNVEGFIPLNEFNFQVTQEYKNNPSLYFYTGEVIKVRITQIKSDKVIASLILDQKVNQHVKVGQKVKATVTNIDENGLTVFISKTSTEGFLPVQHLSVDSTLCHPMLETYNVNDTISNLLIVKADESGITVSRREAIAYERCDLAVPKFQNIRKGTLLRCSVESIEELGIFVTSPIKNFNKKIFVNKKSITKGKDMPQFEIHQSVMGRVMEISQKKEIIVLSLKFENVFDNNIQNSVSLFSDYLADVEYLNKFGSRNNWPLNQYKLAERVQCTVKKVTKDGCLVELTNGCQGLVTSFLCESHKKGDKVEGIVIGHNYQYKYVEICLKKSMIHSINPNQEISDESLPDNKLHFTVHKLTTNDQYIISVLRKDGNKKLVYIPLKLCENDFNKITKSFYNGDTFKVEICGQFGEKLIGFHKKMKHSYDRKLSLQNESESDSNKSCSPKPKHQESKMSDTEEASVISDKEEASNLNEEEDVECSEENNEDLSSDTNEDSGVYSKDYISNSGKDSVTDMDHDQTEETEDEDECDENSKEENVEHVRVKFNGEEVRSFKDQDEICCPLPILPSVSNFFSAQITKKLDDSSSDDEDVKEMDTKKKKKKLTPAEKAEQLRMEEERISKIEKDLADTSKEPDNIEQFERILLAEPNSSALWIKYISHYLALAEFDKARAVGRKALETISMTLEDEKFNIWISLLNLENLYGTKESFEKLFEEAIKFNDAFQIYMKVLFMLYESGKLLELDEKIKKAKTKFKQEPNMWVEIAKIYYLLGRFKEARNMQNSCLKSITNLKKQYSIILKFAILEFTHGEMDMGIAVFEYIIETYPNKVSAWMIYVDQLIKKEQINEVRNLLDRAIAMKLPLRATKVVYHKYRTFEEKYGTPQTIATFKEKARKILEKAQSSLLQS